MRIILTYHGLHARGWSYESNDHIALWHDLKALRKTDYRVLPLEPVVNAVRNKEINRLPENVVAITFDDGVNHDFIDFVHPDFGFLPSFRTIIEDSIKSGFPASATSFVIASEEARKELDIKCIASRGDWSDCWWDEAASCEHWDIGNHSFDHNHAVLANPILRDVTRGQFKSIDNIRDADIQIRRAQEFISYKTSGRARLWFAYPYGEFNSFLSEYYLPKVLGAEAAFTTKGEYLTENSNAFTLPRFVCGDHWKNPAEFLQILTGE